MLERDFQRKLLSALKKHPALGGAVIFKHNDYMTAGVPDVSITLNGATTWFELKVHPNTPTKLQAHFLEKLKPRSMVVTLMPSGQVYCGEIATRDLEAAVELIVAACSLDRTLMESHR